MIKSKANSRKFWGQTAIAVSVTLLCALWILGINNSSSQFLNEIKVKIDKKEGFRDLITKKDVILYVEKEMTNDISMQPIGSLDISLIEKKLNNDSRVGNVEVYVDAHNNLNIDVEQKRPIFRVMNQEGRQFYVDQSGHYINQIDHRAVHVPVVTGYVESLSPEKQLLKKMRLYEIYKIINLAKKDSFLDALIEQINVDKSGRIVIIPKIGNEKIILDHTEELKSKLKNLKQFYKEIAKTNAWDKYDEIDISYDKQVVGRNPVTP